MQFVLLTGIAAGAVHVVSGADHLIAMAPASFTNPRNALKNALSWGLGHSSGIILLSVLTIFIKDFTQLTKLSYFAEFLVGLSLVIVGIMAIKNAYGFNIHSHSHKHNEGFSHKHLHFHSFKLKKHKNHSHALTSLGLLHGIAGGTHLLAVLPALALPLKDAAVYLLAYLLGSVLIMNLFTCLISISTKNVGQKFIKRLIAFAGGISFSMGLFWIQKSTLLFIS